MAQEGTDGEAASDSADISESGTPSAPTSTAGKDTDSGGSSGAGDGVCGDGVVDPHELCDDGNEDDSDACTTACVPAACDDRLRNGDESDIDCGGTCRGCADAATCNTPNDCASGDCYAGSCVPACEPWQVQYGTLGIEGGYGLHIDDAAIYVSGATDGALDGNPSAGMEDVFATKFGLNGEIDFTRQLGGSADDLSLGVTVGPEGVIAIVGLTHGDYDGNTTHGSIDGIVTMLDANTTKLWSVQLGTNDEDDFVDAAFDASGKLYVVGSTRGGYGQHLAQGSNDILVVKLNQDGSEVWNRQLGIGAFEVARRVAVDANNEVVVLGVSNGSFEGNELVGLVDMVLAKFDADGTIQWTLQLGGAEDDNAAGLALDDAGDIYVAGTTNGSFDGNRHLGSSDVFVAKVSSDGETLWSTQFGTSASDSARGIAVDAAGAVYVTGSTFGDLAGSISEGMSDAIVAALDPDGEVDWAQSFGSEGDDVGRGVAVGPHGEIIFAGYSYGSLLERSAQPLCRWARRSCCATRQPSLPAIAARSPRVRVTTRWSPHHCPVDRREPSVPMSSPPSKRKLHRPTSRSNSR